MVFLCLQLSKTFENCRKTGEMPDNNAVGSVSEIQLLVSRIGIGHKIYGSSQTFRTHLHLCSIQTVCTEDYWFSIGFLESVHFWLSKLNHGSGDS